MNTIAVIFGAEFERRVRSRSFIVGTLIGALGIAAIAFLPALFLDVSTSSKNIVVVGDPTLTAAAVRELARDFTIVSTATGLSEKPTLAYLDAHHKAAAVVDLERHDGLLHAVAYVRDTRHWRDVLTRDLGRLQLSLATGLPQARVDALTHVKLSVHDVAGKFADAAQAAAAQGFGYVFVILLYLAILLNAQSIVLSVAEEKSSRIAELLVATIDPARLLLAKVLAATATGFVQLAVWVFTAAALGRAVAGVFADGPTGTASTAGITASEIGWFVVFFTVGFTQCAVLFAAAGSLVSRSEDIAGVTTPLYIPIISAFFIAQLALQFPNAPNVVTFSFVPLFAPFVMFTRIVVGNVPVWQIALSLAINVAAAGVLAWAGGRVYRVGLLLYGGLPSPRQIVAAIRQR